MFEIHPNFRKLRKIFILKKSGVILGLIGLNWPFSSKCVKKREYGLKQFSTFFAVFKHDKLVRLVPKIFKQKM